MDEPYFIPIKNKDGIIMYIVDQQWWQTDNGCGGERSDKFAFSAINISMNVILTILAQKVIFLRYVGEFQIHKHFIVGEVDCDCGCVIVRYNETTSRPATDSDGFSFGE